jgi:cytochrome c-type biogenesis protein CcmH/NrfG
MSFFEQNLAIIEPRNPELASLMRSDIDCSHIEVLPSHHPNVPTARVTLPSGEKVLLHNLEDPIGSAVRSAEKHDMKAENGSILLGFGLGYLAVELAKKLEKKHPLIICEADPAMLKTALTQLDLTTVLESNYIRILVGAEMDLATWIHKLSVKFMTAKVDVISYDPSVHLYPETYERLTQIAQKESMQIVLNRNTTLKAGGRMMENILLNFPDVLRSAGVKRLENLFHGRPAVLVAAGPSLEKNVHLLRELEGRAVIIAVDTALRLLLPLGIKPDIVTTIDFNQVNFQKFANVPIDPDISLVYHPGGYYESIRAFHGPMFTSSWVPNRIPNWLMQYVEDKGGLPGGTTVAHLSFFLARYMGCDPIVFIGQDLAFPKKQIHASDLSLWHINTDEMNTIEDIFGEPVGSMTSFKHAIYYFEKAFKETQATVIDATEAGAKKQGARPMRLREVIDEYCGIPSIDIKGMLREAGKTVEGVRTDDMLRDMDFISAELGLIKKECREVVAVAGRLKKKIDKGEMAGDQFCKLSMKAEKLTQEMDSHGRTLHLMGEQNYALELYMMQHSVSTIDEIEKVDEKIIKQVERAAVFYPSVARAAESFKKQLDRLIDRLKRAHELEAQSCGANATADDWYQRGVAYGKIEYGREALQALREALARDSNHVPALKFAARLLLDGNRTAEALEMLERLSGLTRSDRKLEELVREAQAKGQAWDTRTVRLQEEFAGKAHMESPEEAGWFYYRTKDYRRAVSMLTQAVSEHPTAEGYARLGHARLKMEQREGAVEAWERALALDPSRADLYKAMGELALEQGCEEQAEAFFQESCRLEEDDLDACEKLAHLYLKRGAYLEAGRCYENMLRLVPNRTDLILQIAALYQRQIAMATTQ